MSEWLFRNASTVSPSTDESHIIEIATFMTSWRPTVATKRVSEATFFTAAAAAAARFFFFCLFLSRLLGFFLTDGAALSLLWS